jgi:hypothetical protein
MARVVAYVDGFNLYFGLKQKGWRRYYWLDIQLLAQQLPKFNQQLQCTKYFTARIGGPPDKQGRQARFIEALETLPGVHLFFGKYQINARTCPRCGFSDSVPNEKMTDVNIAVELFRDAVADLYDIALLISADGDLAPVVRAVRESFADKRVVVAFPPARHSTELQEAAHACLTIGRGVIARSQLPETVLKPDGYALRRPGGWQ